MPAGETPASHLRVPDPCRYGQALAWRAARQVRAQVEHELELIAELGYEPFS